MFIRNELKEFMEHMEIILREKFPKYEDSWKTAGIGEFRTEINEQIKKITDIIVAKIDWDKGEVRRKLIHIANYCMFAENKIRND